jgi:polyisoprenoid-binding protein YceI
MMLPQKRPKPIKPYHMSLAKSWKKASLLLLLLPAALLLCSFQPSEGVDWYRCDHHKSGLIWTGKKTFGSHTGTISLKEGSVAYANDTIRSAVFIFDMRSIQNLDLEGSMRERLVHHLQSPDFFDAAQFPEASFRLQQFQKMSGDSALVSGLLCIKGISRSVQFPVQYTVRGRRMEITSRGISVNRKDFNIVLPGHGLRALLGNSLLFDDFLLEFSLVLFRQT